MALTDDNGKTNPLTRQLRWLIAGAAAGLAVDLSLYPMDTIKTRMQSKSGFSASGGFRNIYRGLPAVALGSAPGSALFFLTYSNSKDLIQRRNSTGNLPTPLIDALSAAFGEICACIVRVPTEICKQRAQTSSTQNRPLPLIMQELYTNGGLRGFYKGYVSTVFREIPFSFIEFPLWEWFKRKVVERRSGKGPVLECSPFESAACGSLAGLVAAAITTPLDVLKTRVMLDTVFFVFSYLFPFLQAKQTRLLPTALAVMRNEGILRLYSGMVPRATWIGTGGFIFFFAYEFSHQAVHNYLF